MAHRHRLKPIRNLRILGGVYEQMNELSQLVAGFEAEISNIQRIQLLNGTLPGQRLIPRFPLELRESFSCERVLACILTSS